MRFRIRRFLGLGLGMTLSLSLFSYAEEVTSQKATVSDGITLPGAKTDDVGCTVQPGADCTETNPPSSSAVPVVKKVSPQEIKGLRRSFGKAQSGAIAALIHRQRFERKELQKAHGIRRREFTRGEATQRKAFFQKNRDRKLRKDYMKKSALRAKDFMNVLKEERMAARQRYKDEMRNLKVRLKEAKSKFEEALRKKVQPAANLWPNE